MAKTIIYPPNSAKSMAGGFLSRIMDNLPRAFRKTPKLHEVFAYRNGIGRGGMRYISLRDGFLYMHNQPLDTAGVSPERSFDLSEYNMGTLADAIMSITAFGAEVLDMEYDLLPASLLYGEFVDFEMPGSTSTDEVWLNLSTDTSNLGRFLYPVAQTLNMLSKDIDDGEGALYRAFAKGFWIDFWGDWLGVPRPSGMADDAYSAFLSQYSNVPRTTNMAMEDLLAARYGFPAYVTDGGYKFFNVSVDASLTNIPIDDMISFVSSIKAAGVDWQLSYYSNHIENFQAYYYGRYTTSGGIGKEFKNSDSEVLASAGMTFQEQTFGYPVEDGGFMFGTATFNGTTTGGARRLKDTYTMQYIPG